MSGNYYTLKVCLFVCLPAWILLSLSTFVIFCRGIINLSSLTASIFTELNLMVLRLEDDPIYRAELRQIRSKKSLPLPPPPPPSSPASPASPAVDKSSSASQGDVEQVGGPEQKVNCECHKDADYGLDLPPTQPMPYEMRDSHEAMHTIREKRKTQEAMEETTKMLREVAEKDPKAAALMRGETSASGSASGSAVTGPTTTTNLAIFNATMEEIEPDKEEEEGNEEDQECVQVQRKMPLGISGLYYNK